MRGQYDTALVCMEGHTINSAMRRWPDSNRKFCEQCGSATISACVNCSRPIPGDYEIRAEGAYAAAGPYFVPAFCGDCGAPYPWTASRLQAAHEVISELESLDPDERLQLEKSIGELVRETARSKVAAMRFKKLVLKAGKEGAEALRRILTDIASDAVKKMLSF